MAANRWPRLFRCLALRRCAHEPIRQLDDLLAQGRVVGSRAPDPAQGRNLVHQLGPVGSGLGQRTLERLKLGSQHLDLALAFVLSVLQGCDLLPVSPLDRLMVILRGGQRQIQCSTDIPGRSMFGLLLPKLRFELLRRDTHRAGTGIGLSLIHI